MAYPRQLNLDKETELRLKTFLDGALQNHSAERGDHVQDLMDWQRDYWIKPGLGKRTFPFLGASNVVIPLTAIAVEAVHARTMTTLFAVEPFLSVKARAGINAKQLLGFDLTTVEQPLENYMQYELIEQMDFERAVNSFLLEQEKFGTGIGKGGYERVIRSAMRQVGEIEEELTVVVKDGPTVKAVPNANYIQPFNEDDPQLASFCGEYHSWTPLKVKLAGESGLFYADTFEKLKAWVLDGMVGSLDGRAREFRSQQQEFENKEPVIPKTIDFVEIWGSFNVDKSPDGKEKEIVIYYHPDSGIFMSIRYNWNSDLHRDYRLEPYMPVEHRWCGIGICKQNDQFQREVTTIHRQRLDNATLANMRMFKVSKLSGYGPGEPIFPGKMWFLDDMEHISDLQLSEVYPSSFSNEQATLLYSQQRTGVSDVTLGVPQTGTPGTATSDLARIQEGQKKFDFTFGNAKKLVSALSFDTLVNIAQFGTKNASWFDIAEGGDRVRLLLTQDPKLIRDGILLKMAAVGSQSNRVADRQNWERIAAILQSYYTALFQISQLTGDPKLISLITQKAMIASTEAMKQILESFDVRNVDRLIVNELVEQLDDGRTQLTTGQPGALSVGATGGGPEGNGTPQGLDSILEIMSQLSGGAAAPAGRG